MVDTTNNHITDTINFAQQPKVVARGARLMVSSGGCEQPPNGRFALRSHRVLCAQPRRQHQIKLRRLAARLLAEFRAPARNARCERTQKGGLFLFIDVFFNISRAPRLTFFLISTTLALKDPKSCY